MRVLAALIWKDLIIEVRTRELLTSMSLVAFLALVILSLAFEPSPAMAVNAAPGVLWVTVAFTATLGLARSHALEQERQAFQGLLLTPVSRSLLFLLVLQLVVVVAFAALFTPEVGRRALWLVPPLALGAVGFTAIGTLLGTMTATTRLREVLLPILLLPVVLPVIILSMAGLNAAIDGGAMGEIQRSLKLLAAVDIIYLVLGMWLFEYVAEDAA